jgi:hypothetical protein
MKKQKLGLSDGYKQHANKLVLVACVCTPILHMHLCVCVCVCVCVCHVHVCGLRAMIHIC